MSRAGGAAVARGGGGGAAADEAIATGAFSLFVVAGFCACDRRSVPDARSGGSFATSSQVSASQRRGLEVSQLHLQTASPVGP